MLIKKSYLCSDTGLLYGLLCTLRNAELKEPESEVCHA